MDREWYSNNVHTILKVSGNKEGGKARGRGEKITPVEEIEGAQLVSQRMPSKGTTWRDFLHLGFPGLPTKTTVLI